MTRPASPASGARLCIVRRQSPDWTTLTPGEFAAQSRAFYRWLGRPEDEGIRNAALWDRTFAISFCETRQAMKDIATATLRAVEDALLLGSPADLPVPTAADDAPGRLLCLFTDDDDWVRPDARRVLAAHASAEYDGYLWRQVRCGFNKGEWLQISPRDDACGTNNYAVDAAFLRADAANLGRVYQHMVANTAFPSLRVRALEAETLTATLRNPSGTLALARGLDGHFEPARLAAFIDRFNARLARPLPAPPPAGAAWVLPWLDEVRRFYRRLADSRRA